MDCSVCGTFSKMLQPPRNTICGSCYDGAKSLIYLMNQIEHNKALNKATSHVSPNFCLGRSCKTLAHATKWATDLIHREEELQEKIDFLGEFVAAFRHRIHTDIQLKPGSAASPSISAHRALLATRSEIFKNMLESDGCKAAPAEAIALPEMSQDELEALLEFLYGGNLAEEKMEKHVYSLSVASDKYEIRYLQRFCERYMERSLNCGNALDVLEVADVCSFGALKESALNFVVKNTEEIVFSSRFDAFALKNPHLSLQVTRASLIDAKKNIAPTFPST